MRVGGGAARGRWGTAIALTIAVLFLSVLHAVPLVALPLALLLVALPGRERWKQAVLGLAVWAVAVLLSGGPLADLTRGWALLLGSAFLLATLWRPRWRVLPRALLALAAAYAVAALWLAASGGWGGVDQTLREHYEVSARALGDLAERMPESSAAQRLSASSARVAQLQWRLFPGVLALQSLAALGLASWWAMRLRRGDRSLRLRPLREFRFNDQLIWILIAGLVLVLLPLGALATRVGYNALLFMGGLYALRGVGVFVFLAGGAPPLLSVLFGVLAAIFLYPLVLTAAVLVGLGDTWLDVRARATAAPK